MQLALLVIDAPLLQTGQAREFLCDPCYHTFLCDEGWIGIGVHLLDVGDKLETEVQPREKRFEAPEDLHLFLFGQIAYIAPLDLENRPVAAASPAFPAFWLAIPHDTVIQHIKLDPRLLDGRWLFSSLFPTGGSLQLVERLPGGAPGNDQ